MNSARAMGEINEKLMVLNEFCKGDVKNHWKTNDFSLIMQRRLPKSLKKPMTFNTFCKDVYQNQRKTNVFK